MIHTFLCGDTTVYAAPVPNTARHARHEAERAAVAAIIAAKFGAGTVLGHRADGAPLLEGTHVSVSHTRGLAVVAVNPRTPVGIDAELPRTALARTARRFLSATEMQWCTSLPLMLAAWTAKEAVYKVVGSDAYDLAGAIETGRDMLTARSCGMVFDLVHFSVGAAHVCLAVPRLS